MVPVCKHKQSCCLCAFFGTLARCCLLVFESVVPDSDGLFFYFSGKILDLSLHLLKPNLPISSNQALTPLHGGDIFWTKRWKIPKWSFG